MVQYKDSWLAKGSYGYELWEKKNFKELDAHCKALDNKEKELIERYRQKTETEKNVEYLKGALNGNV